MNPYIPSIANTPISPVTQNTQFLIEAFFFYFFVLLVTFVIGLIITFVISDLSDLYKKSLNGRSNGH